MQHDSAAAKASGIAESLWMTLGLSDGKTVYAARYASDGEAPTLYYSKSVEDLAQLGLSAQVAKLIGPQGRMIVSEPVGKIAEAWVMLPQASALRLSERKLEVLPFRPTVPSRVPVVS